MDFSRWPPSEYTFLHILLTKSDNVKNKSTFKFRRVFWCQAIENCSVHGNSPNRCSPIDDSRDENAHKVSLVSLYLLQLRSYTVYCSSVQGPPESRELWIQRCRSSDKPMFMFWATIMDLELLMCRFIRSLREGDFPLYVQVCDEMCSWFHVMDGGPHQLCSLATNPCARHMVQLSQKHPQLHAEFLGVTLLCRGQLTSSA